MYLDTPYLCAQAKLVPLHFCRSMFLLKNIGLMIFNIINVNKSHEKMKTNNALVCLTIFSNL